MICINRNVYCLVILAFLFQINNLFAKNNNELTYDAYNINNYISSATTNDGMFLIDTHIVYDPAPSVQGFPSIIYNGTNYLVVWEDARDNSQSIYGSRISENGEILDKSGFRIYGDYNAGPSVAFDGENYLVVWTWIEDYWWEPMYWINGAIVSPSGTVLAFIYYIGNIGLANTQPSVAFDGENYLVVWRCGDLYGARVSPSGVILDSIRIAISTAANAQIHPSVAFDGDNYFVVWMDNRSGSDFDIYGARVSPIGIVLDSSGLAISTAAEDQFSPSVSFDGDNYFVVWSDYRNGSDYDIYGARIDQYGNVLDSSGVMISVASGSQEEPSVFFDSRYYLVTWQDSRDSGDWDIYGSRVKRSGEVLDPSGIPIADLTDWQTHPAVSSNGEVWHVVWENGHSNQDIYGIRVDQSGTVVDTSSILISTVVNEQKEPSTAFDGSNYLVVWQEYRNTFWDIYGARVNPDGNMIDSLTIAISTGSLDELYPEIAFGDIDSLTVWEAGNIYGARVTQAGIVLDPAGFTISGGWRAKHWPSVSSDGTDYLVVWEDQRNVTTTGNDIYGARVSASGIVLDSSGIAISKAINNQDHPSVAFGGENYFIVWTDSRYGSSRAFGARVSSAGYVLDTAGILIPPDSLWSASPLVAFDGTNYLVVWKGYQNSNWYYFGVRISQSGVVLDSIKHTIAYTGPFFENKCLSFDGSNYIFVWERPGADWDICGVRVDTSGTVIDSFIVSQQPGNQLCPAIVRGTGNRLLITYSSWTDSINAHPVNAMRIWGKLCTPGVEEMVGFNVNEKDFSLQVYPSLVREKITIKYILPMKTEVVLTLFDITGRVVRQIINETQGSGIYNTSGDMVDLPQGVYFVRLTTENYSDTKKIVLVK